MQCTHCVYTGELRMREGHTYIIGPEQPVKGFSAKFSFCTETLKLSPSKVFCYTVYTYNTDISKMFSLEKRSLHYNNILLYLHKINNKIYYVSIIFPYSIPNGKQLKCLIAFNNDAIELDTFHV